MGYTERSRIMAGEDTEIQERRRENGIFGIV